MDNDTSKSQDHVVLILLAAKYIKKNIYLPSIRLFVEYHLLKSAGDRCRLRNSGVLA